MMYTTENRGKILYPERKRQIVDFQGLRYGSITPTDMDGYIEKEDEMFIFYEYKHGNAPVPNGQKRAFVNLVNALRKAEKKAVFMICRHDQHNPLKNIDGANSIVDEYYYNKRWHNGGNRTVKEVTDSFMNYVDVHRKDNKQATVIKYHDTQIFITNDEATIMTSNAERIAELSLMQKEEPDKITFILCGDSCVAKVPAEYIQFGETLES